MTDKENATIRERLATLSLRLKGCFPIGYIAHAAGKKIEGQLDILAVRLISMLFILFFSSCSSVIYTIYGLKLHKTYDVAEIESFSKKNHIPQYEILEKKEYGAKLGIVKDETLRHDLRQPLQFWVITHDEVLCNTLNCNASVFLNLKWDFSGIYKNKMVCSPVKNSDLIYNVFSIPKTNDTTAVICYSLIMGRQNRRFLKQCNIFLNKHKDFRVKYCNMDNVVDK